MIRFLRWCLGLDPLDVLNDRIRSAELDRHRMRQERDQHRNERRKALADLNDARRAAMARAEENAKLRAELLLEQTTRGLYEQVLVEAGQQIEKNKGLAPATLLGVLAPVFAEAVATGIAWRAEGAPEMTTVTNMRATLANRLLSEPDRSKDQGGMRTERNRTGRAGDSTTKPKASLPHTYEYDLFGGAGPNREGKTCNVLGCGKPLADPIHSGRLSMEEVAKQIAPPTGSITSEKRPEDGPPEALPPRGVPLPPPEPWQGRSPEDESDPREDF